MKFLRALCLVTALMAQSRFLSAQEVASAMEVPRQIKRTSAQFVTPPKLRGRVDFWKAIFTRYGKHFAVLHHKDYPQVIFKVLDFTKVAQSMSPVAYERYRNRVIADRTKEIRAALTQLANSPGPDNDFQAAIADSMQFIPGGYRKYERVLKEDLIRSQTGIREKYGDAIARSGRYLRILENIFVNEYHLPVELTRLPFVESSFDYQAYSSVGAAGIWQFMPKTGRLYLSINKAVDERRDPVQSTRAAARYLSSAYQQLGTWPLALTSYNHGVAGVARKVRMLGTSDIASIVEDHDQRVFGFASNNFFPEFLAALEVYDDHRHYFPDVALEKPLSVFEVRLPTSMSVKYICNQVGIKEAELRSVNYAISEKVWRGQLSLPANYHLMLPENYRSQIAKLKLPEPKSLALAPAASVVSGGTYYKVRSGDTLVSVAKKFSVSLKQLRALNNLGSDKLKVGQGLVVKGSVAEKAKTVSEKSRRDSAPAGIGAPDLVDDQPSRSYLVKKGDTLWSVSKALNVPVDQLKKRNKIKGSALRVGQRLSY